VALLENLNELDRSTGKTVPLKTRLASEIYFFYENNVILLHLKEHKFMKTSAIVSINASKETIWKKITDIEHSADFIDSIEKIEIFDNPANSLIGFKWKETRTMFGKKATEIMWITEAEENIFYQTRAESHGSLYITRVEISEQENSSALSMELNAKAVSIGAKIMMILFGLLFKGATRKALLQDLTDIKNTVENAE